MKHCVGVLSAVNPAIVSYDFQSSQETASQIQLGQKKEIFQKAVCLSQLMEVISVYLCNVIVDLESLTAGSKTVMCHVSAVTL